MNSVKVVSKILYYIARVLSFFYFVCVALSLLALTTTWGLHIREGGKYFSVNYPFTNTHFLNGDYNIIYIIFFFLLPISLYGLFFLLLGNVFKVFFQPRLFTSYGVQKLRLFYLANCIIPGLMVLVTSFFAEFESEAMVLVVLHFTLGVFAYFLAAIFKQGVKLQNEQDLYI
ncbi:DUF2975 domain-containing protein [Niastella caeni]|uniref:DUF2975 domain-containing protein n=1 Tax=Niastella caeni TaxID=2569763 RepID=A0A4S8HZ07_9BACT|nr:DUF2975 domain-containing protein [Niastella caeni]THU40987.1 DUF2975 domain-containing protein [Niastella caeni]